MEEDTLRADHEARLGIPSPLSAEGESDESAAFATTDPEKTFESAETPSPPLPGSVGMGGDDMGEGSPEEAADLLVFIFRESGDAEIDAQRLRDLRQVIRQWPGDDPFAIAFEGGTSRYRLTGGDARLQRGAELETAIEALLGPGSVRLEPTPAAAILY